MPRSSTFRAGALIGFAAFVSFVLSVSLWFTGNEHQAIFVGLWVPSILALGAFALTLKNATDAQRPIPVSSNGHADVRDLLRARGERVR